MSQQHSKNQLKLLTDTLSLKKIVNSQNSLSKNKQPIFSPKQNVEVFHEYYSQHHPESARLTTSQESPRKGNNFLNQGNQQNQFQHRLMRSKEKTASQVVQQGITQMKLKTILKSSLQRQQQQHSMRSIQNSNQQQFGYLENLNKNSINSFNNTSNDDQNALRSIFNGNLQSPRRDQIVNITKDKQFSMSVHQQLNPSFIQITPEVKLPNKPDLKLDFNNINKVVTECLSERAMNHKQFSKFKPIIVNPKQLEKQTQYQELIIQKLKLEQKQSDINKSDQKNLLSARDYKSEKQDSFVVTQSNKTDKAISKQTNLTFTTCDSKTALSKYSHYLTKHERQEILEFDIVYFIGQQSTKIVDTDQGCNFGYDNEKGDFIFRLNDHISYRYEMLGKLGKGSFGQAFKVFDHKRGGFMAMKVIKNKKRFHAQALEEIQILKCVRDSCQSIVKIKDYFVFRSHVCIGFELLSWNLYDFLKQNNFKGLQLNLIRKFSIQLLQALFEMECRGVIHCDLKPENILLRDQNKCGIKVIDFGSSCLKQSKLYTYIQSRFYRAPEIFFELPYDTHIDLWSFGCIMVELITGRPLFQSENETDHISQIIETLGRPPISMIKRSRKRDLLFDASGQFFNMTNMQGKRRFEGVRPLEYILQTCPPNMIEFVGAFLKWNPEQRLTPAEGLVHPWILEGLPKKIKKQHLQVMRSRAPNVFNGRTISGCTSSSEQSQERQITIIDKDPSQGIQGESKFADKKTQRQ